MEYIVKQDITPELSNEIRQAFAENMDDKYFLVYTDYRDTYENSADNIQKCLNGHNSDFIDMDWVGEACRDSSLEELEKLKSTVLSNNKYEHIHPLLDDWLDDNRELILSMIEERDDSTPVTDVAERTKLRARATLYTNYDCLMHNFDMNNTYYYDEYFKDIIDVLCLNPSKVKQIFNQKGINTIGKWPNKWKRNGNEAVRYEDLAEEMLNQCCYGLLTFMGMLPLSDLFKNDFAEYKTIVIPKGNMCGMFSHWNGGGSLMEMELLRDLYIPATFHKKTKYDKCELLVDEFNCGNGYCINEVYGLMFSCWKKEFKLLYN